MPEYDNLLIKTCRAMGVKQEDGKWLLTDQQLMSLQEAFYRELAKMFRADKTVKLYIPEHMIHSMIIENFESVIK